MTVKPRTRSEDERFLKDTKTFSDISAVSGSEFTLILFIFILVYIFARAIWEAIRDLREENKPKKKERISTTPVHYPK